MDYRNLIGAGALVLALGAAGAASAQTVTGPVKSAADTGKCVDVEGSGIAPNTAVNVFDCNGTDAQSWTITHNAFNTATVTLTSNLSGRPVPGCLTVSGAPVEGAKAVIDNCLPFSSNQSFYPTESGNSYQFAVEAAPSLCLYATGLGNNSPIELRDCDSQAAEVLWDINGSL